ncbi:MAG: long-chain fatty acid--CoA ligase [bacterium]|nr:long-chain fatty acid--CoA ligase [bacterium]
MFEKYNLTRPDNLVEMFEQSVENFAKEPWLGTKNNTGEYEWVLYSDMGRRVDKLRGGLSYIGVEKGDSVGIIANNCVDWAIGHFATAGLGALYVPMYEAELLSVWEYIIRDSAVKILFVSKAEIYEKIKSFPEKISTLEKIYLLSGDGDNTMTALEKIGEQNPATSFYPAPEDEAVLVYTSGTTGDPKGVLLMHGNWTSTHFSRIDAYPFFSSNDRTMSLLPWAHCFGLGEMHTLTAVGGSLGFLESPETVVEDMSKVKPTFLIAVPRVFNRVYDRITTTVTEAGGVKKFLFTMGVTAAKKKRELTEKGKTSLMANIKFNIINKIVFQKIRDLFGGRLIGAVTGSAAMNPEISKFFFDIGIPLYDGYGLSETTATISCNSPDCYRIGSVGQILKDLRVEIDQTVVESDAPDGEIIAYGPNVMKGYHNKPEATAQTMTADRGLRTGDRGRLDEDGFLWITGRIKDQFKLANGKYVFPASIEEDICLNHYVENAMIYGAGCDYTICIIVPDFLVLQSYMKKNNLSQIPEDMISSAVTSGLKNKYAGYEIPKKFLFFPEPFSLENGMLTQTLKVKRRVIIEKLKDQIMALYQEGK